MKKSHIVGLMLFIFLAFAGILMTVFGILFQTAKENVINTWEAKASEMANDTSSFLNVGCNAVDFTAGRLDQMIDSGASKEEVLTYLETQSGVFKEAVGGGYDGVYSWYRGSYIDGVGWTPTEGYIATDRPWYKAAKKAKNKVTITKPYLDAETRTVITTCTKLLKDGDSAVALDLHLEELQEMTDELASETKGESVAIIDDSGFVVTHSDQNKVGEDLSKDQDPMWREIAKQAVKEHQRRFEVRGGSKYLVLTEPINDSWQVVMTLDETTIFNSLMFIYMISALALLVVTIGMILLVTYINRKQANEQNLQYLSETDQLTGLLNRRGGEGRIRKYLADKPTGMFVLFDIDHFKLVNDNYGHDVGDQVLIAVAKSLQESCRANDVAVRLGGDEFVAFVPEIDNRENGALFIRRLIENVESIQIPEMEGRKIHISLGATLINESNATGGISYKQADICMYESKKKEGSQYTFYDESAEHDRSSQE